TGGLPDAWQSMSESVAAGLAWAADGSPGTEADFRVQVFDAEYNPSNWSNTVNATLAVDNTAPAAPSVTASPHVPVDGVTLEIAAAALNVVRLLVEYNFDDGGWTTDLDETAYRPAATVTRDIDGFVENSVSDKMLQWRISAFISNGTQSAYTSGSVVLPGITPP